VLNSDVIEAIYLAAEAHKNQRRKGPEALPYVNHLIEVATLLTRAGVDDAITIQAAILHDILEDTTVSEVELTDKFGKAVVDLVKNLSDDKNLSLEKRRSLQLTKLNCCSRNIKLIKLADHCSNIASIPGDWEHERIESYFNWSSKIAALCFSESEFLKREYLDRVDRRKRASSI
jgi:guanosine-3',5'-bis(diphosphate) 3'-pyrophosphohydrolase